jgi:hypothetical protein
VIYLAIFGKMPVVSLWMFLTATSKIDQPLCPGYALVKHIDYSRSSFSRQV